MASATLTLAEKDVLLEELAQALQKTLHTSCADMVPLWLEATCSARKHLGVSEPMQMSEDERQRYLALGNPSKSKYRALAVWRHAVHWHDLLPQVDDEDFAAAARVVYFTPFPANTTPYAWTKKAANAPGVGAFDGPRQLKRWAKEGAYRLVMGLVACRDQWERDGSWPCVARLDLTCSAIKGTAWDVLKLDDFPRPDRPAKPLETSS